MVLSSEIKNNYLKEGIPERTEEKYDIKIAKLKKPTITKELSFVYC